MATTLLLLGIACLIAAIVGGGLSAFGTEFPVISSLRRQFLIALFGLILITVGIVDPWKPPPPPPPSPTAAPTLPPTKPDLMVTDIILKPRPADYGSIDDVIINTVVKNNGADTQQGFIVGCNFTCSNSQRYFSGMQLSNGLEHNQEITLGNDTLLYLGDCSFQAEREFTCTVDPDDLVAELDESNNTWTETLLTSR